MIFTGAESKVEKYLRTEAKKHGFLCYKFVSPANNGVPDRILIGHGKTLFVETKAPGEDARKLQKRVHARMREHGATVLIIDNKDKIDNLFKEILSNN